MSPKNVSIRFAPDMRGLNMHDLRLLMMLVKAAQWVDTIYLKQCNSPDGFDSDQPNNFFPRNATKESVEAYLAEHPESRADILSPFTIVVETPNGGLAAIPYSEFYKEEMGQIADILSQAARFAKDEQFRDFLLARSNAFRTNQYRESDIAWIRANNGPIEFTIGPLEDYADKLFGVKRTFQCVVGLVLSKETREAAQFQDLVVQFDAALGKRYGYVGKPTLTPMVVMDQVYLSGASAYGNLAMAYNLPNDPDIQIEVGSKKVFIRNVMQAKFEHMTMPIANRVLRANDAATFDFETYLRFIVGHESSHGLSFCFDGEHFGHLSNAIEECKADVFGIWFLYFLASRGVFKTHVAETAVMIHLADCLRQIRFGPEKAHAIGALIQFNWFLSRNVVTLTERGMTFNPFQFREAVTMLGDTLYSLATSKDAGAATKFVECWGRFVPKYLRLYLDRFTDLPFDIDPIFQF